jgi:cullin 1
MFLGLVQTAFKGDAGFMGSLDKACREFVNRNALCKTSAKSPELLARFSDGILKKGSKTVEDGEVESVLDNIVCNHSVKFLNYGR